jgi:glycerophosphoryl diester phosphodiesterase
VKISAHRGGYEGIEERENSPSALAAAAAMGVDFVEFDVQQTRDGFFVLSHGDDVQTENGSRKVAEHSLDSLLDAGAKLLRYEEALSILRNRSKAHIDLKFMGSDGDRAAEVEAARIAIDIMGLGNFVLTSLEDQSVHRLRAWLSANRMDSVLVGLSLGRDLDGKSNWHKLTTRRSELFPGRRYRECNANLVVVHRQLARATVLRWARRHNLPALVWTVDDPKELESFLEHPDVWMLTTNFPRRALEVRDRVEGNSDGRHKRQF